MVIIKLNKIKADGKQFNILLNKMRKEIINLTVKNVIDMYISGDKQFADSMDNRTLKTLMYYDEFDNLPCILSDIIEEELYINSEYVEEFIEEIIEDYADYIINYSGEFDSDIDEELAVEWSVSDVIREIFGECLQALEPILLMYLNCFIKYYIEQELESCDLDNDWTKDFHLIMRHINKFNFSTDITYILYSYHMDKLGYDIAMKHNNIVDRCAKLLIEKYSFDDEIAKERVLIVIHSIYIGVLRSLDDYYYPNIAS